MDEIFKSIFMILILGVFVLAATHHRSPPIKPQENVEERLPLSTVECTIDKDMKAVALTVVRGKIKRSCRYLLPMNPVVTTAEVRCVDAEHGVVIYTENGKRKEEKFIIIGDTITFLNGVVDEK